MEQNLHFISTKHQRVAGGWEQNPSFVNREIIIRRSADLNRMELTISPTLSTKRASLEVTESIFSDSVTHQDTENANILKYIGDDPDYVFYVRNKNNFSSAHYFMTPENIIEMEFSGNNDLMLVLERVDRNFMIYYYQ